MKEALNVAQKIGLPARIHLEVETGMGSYIFSDRFRGADGHHLPAPVPGSS